MKRATGDKAKKQHTFQYDSPFPWQTGPMSLPIESYSDYASFSDLAESDWEVIDKIEKQSYLNLCYFNLKGE